MGFWVWGSGCVVWCFGFGALVSMVWGLGFGVEGSGVGIWVWDLGSGVQGLDLGFRV